MESHGITHKNHLILSHQKWPFVQVSTAWVAWKLQGAATMATTVRRAQAMGPVPGRKRCGRVGTELEQNLPGAFLPAFQGLSEA